MKEAKDALEVVKRQAVVYSMYARKHKSIMVSRSAASHFTFSICIAIAGTLQLHMLL